VKWQKSERARLRKVRVVDYTSSVGGIFIFCMERGVGCGGVCVAVACMHVYNSVCKRD
jgi:hypothetical protein